jgi:hypothetical protein
MHPSMRRHVHVDGPSWQAFCDNCHWFGDAHGNPEDAYREANEHDCDHRGTPSWFRRYLKGEL